MPSQRFILLLLAVASVTSLAGATQGQHSVWPSLIAGHRDKLQDIEIIANEAIFRSHKLLLTFISKRFSDLISESPTKIVVDEPARAVELFLEWLYTGKVAATSSDDSVVLAHFARRFEVESLKIALEEGSELELQHRLPERPWTLVAWGNSGWIGGSLNSAIGDIRDPRRQGFARMDARGVPVNTVCISWNRFGFPTGGPDSYDFAIEFPMPTTNPCFHSFARADSETWLNTSRNAIKVPVTITSNEDGSLRLPAVMYTFLEHLAVDFGHSYGVVLNPAGSGGAGNPKLDWHPDTQLFSVVYVAFIRDDFDGRQSGYVIPEPGGVGNGYVPSTMAIWFRA